MTKKNLIRFDWAIKRILRNKAHFGILEGLLSELLGEDIFIENLIDPEGNKETDDNKSNVVDVLAKDTRGEYIIIEVSNDYMQDYLLRMLFGTSKIIIDTIKQGQNYEKIKKVISVHIVYFDLGQGEDYVYYGSTNFIGLHKRDTLKLSKREQEVYHTEEIAKVLPEFYIIRVNDFDNVAKDTLDEWIRFFKTEEIDENTKAKGLREASEELDILKLKPKERAEYDAFVKARRDSYSTIVGNYNKGKFEGRIEGKIEGKIEITKNLIAEGLDNGFIVKCTGLTEEEINAIRREMEK